jgi:hypothetical protein
MAVLWALMMLLWLAGLLYGLWQAFPLLARMQVDGELLATLAWLVMGAAAWLLALNLGIRRYWAAGRR